MANMTKENPEAIVTGLSTMASSIEFIDRYNQWILGKYKQYIGVKLLEIGTGHSNFKRYFPSIKQYVSVDLDYSVIQRAREKYPDDIFIVADISKDDFAANISGYEIDTILCTNVIEHIKNDKQAIENLLSVLSPNGHLLLFVPALPQLYNDLDRLAGHYRRYTKQTIKSAICASHQIVLLEYFNPIGGIGWWINNFITHKNIDSENVNTQVKFFDKYMVPISKLLNPLTKSFFGQSLICVIKKNN